MERQSFISKIITSALCVIFHSRFDENVSISSNAAKKANSFGKKSYYKPCGYEIIRKEFDGFAVELTKPKKAKSNNVIFHIHGGSFKMKLNDIYRREAVYYSKIYGGAQVYSVDYRVYPDISYPTAHEDVYNAYLSVISGIEKGKRIIVIGDSCGSNMAASLCIKLRESGLPLPSLLILFSFWGDLTNSGASYKDNCHRDPFFGIPKRLYFEQCEKKLRKVTDYANGKELTDPHLSPCFCDFSSFPDFPETVLITGSADISQSDSLNVYEKMKKAKVKVHLLNFENMFHDFQLVKFLPETKRVFRFLKTYM